MVESAKSNQGKLLFVSYDQSIVELFDVVANAKIFQMGTLNTGGMLASKKKKKKRNRDNNHKKTKKKGGGGGGGVADVNSLHLSIDYKSLAIYFI